jgi:hypothetical protein
MEVTEKFNEPPQSRRQKICQGACELIGWQLLI